MELSLDFASLAEQYRQNSVTPLDVVRTIYKRIDSAGNDGVWISLTPFEAALKRARELESLTQLEREKLPLYGIPFNVKDNIDANGLPTTAACPSFSYLPETASPVIDRLLNAGAILIGKTNMDQFATGLVGVRSPYGIPRNPFNAAYIPGGSSSGAGVSVAAGLVSFAIGTDTGGSGRVPASYNNLVGIKPSLGLLSSRGSIPANRSLDCLSIFALTVADGVAVRRVAEGYDADDPFSRRKPPDTIPSSQSFRFAVPEDSFLEFYGDHENAALFKSSRDLLIELGAEPVPIDYSTFLEINSLLFLGPFVAERASSLRAFPTFDPASLLTVTRTVLDAADTYTARDAFAALHRLKTLRRAAEHALADTDFLVVPTTPTIWTLDDVAAHPLERNFANARYTNFVNFLDMSAIALPMGFRSNGLPAGLTLCGPAFSDDRLAVLAERFQRRTHLPLGATNIYL